jgi:exodeoxyribonuclease VII small subunit
MATPFPSDRNANDQDAHDGAAKSAQTSRPDDVPFESSLDALAGLVGRLESGALGLTESIVAYEQGVVLLRRLHAQLADAEERVRMLVRIDEQGRPILAPVGGSEANPAAAAQPSADAPAARAGKATPRAGRSRRLPGMDDNAAGG